MKAHGYEFRNYFHIRLPDVLVLICEIRVILNNIKL